MTAGRFCCVGVIMGAFGALVISLAALRLLPRVPPAEVFSTRRNPALCDLGQVFCQKIPDPSDAWGLPHGLMCGEPN